MTQAIVIEPQAEEVAEIAQAELNEYVTQQAQELAPEAEEFPVDDLCSVPYSMYQKVDKQLLRAEGFIRFFQICLENGTIQLQGNEVSIEVLTAELNAYLAA